MKRKLKFAIFSLLATFLFGTFFVACNDDDKLPTKIEDAFRAKYPNATNVYHKRD